MLTSGQHTLLNSFRISSGIPRKPVSYPAPALRGLCLPAMASLRLGRTPRNTQLVLHRVTPAWNRLLWPSVRIPMKSAAGSDRSRPRASATGSAQPSVRSGSRTHSVHVSKLPSGRPRFRSAVFCRAQRQMVSAALSNSARRSKIPSRKPT